MPEGPELHLASRFVNMVCRNRIFTGKVKKSEVSTRQVDVEWDEPSYKISAVSRGKEVKLRLSVVNNITGDSIKKEISNHNKLEQNQNTMDLLFQFGMSGKFDFYEATELKKHAHLNFFTKDDPKMVLSFVDVRRFGKWTVNADWSPERGPCVLFEYEQFRKNVLNNLDSSAFNKPICEALLNQKYFNGIGNYLRAEILYRSKTPPFVSARSVLQPLVDVEVKNGSDDKSKVKVKQEHGDFLQLCNQLPLEVVNLGCTGYDPEGRDPDYSKFSEWLQCYYNPKMKNMADHNKRTIWFDGIPGPMLPKEGKTRKMKPILKNKKKPKEKTVDGLSKDEKVTKVKLKVEPKSKAKQKSTNHSARSNIKKVTRSVLKEADVVDASIGKKTRKRKLKAADTTDSSEYVPTKQSKPVKPKVKKVNQKKTAAKNLTVQSNKSENGVRTRRKAQC